MEANPPTEPPPAPIIGRFVASPEAVGDVIAFREYTQTVYQSAFYTGFCMALLLCVMLAISYFVDHAKRKPV